MRWNKCVSRIIVFQKQHAAVNMVALGLGDFEIDFPEIFREVVGEPPATLLQVDVLWATSWCSSSFYLRFENSESL